MADPKGIRIVVDDVEVLRRLAKLNAATDKRDDAEHAIGAYLVTATQRRFERGIDPSGKPWLRLKPRTAAKRINGRPRGYDNILRVSRALEQSITYRVEDHDIAVGSNKIYAAIQQLGGTIEMPEREQTIYQHYNAKTDTLDQTFRSRRRSNFARDVKVKAHNIVLPARPYLGLDDEDRKEIGIIIDEHFRKEGGLQ